MADGKPNGVGQTFKVGDGLPGEPLVAVVKMPNGNIATVWNIQPKAALRYMLSAVEDLRDQIYAEREQRIVQPPPDVLVKP